MTSKVKLAPFTCLIEPGFWIKYSGDKLTTYGLSDADIPLTLSYTNSPGVGIPAQILACAEYGFDTNAKLGSCDVVVRGVLKNYNTYDEFNSLNRTELANTVNVKLLAEFLELAFLDNPSILFSTYIFAFSDLKKFIFYSATYTPAIYYPQTQLLHAPYVPLPSYFASLSSNNNNNPSSTVLDFTKAVFSHISEHCTQTNSFPGVVIYDTSTHTCHPCTILHTQPLTDTQCLVYVDPSSSSAMGWPILNISFLFSIIQYCHTSITDIHTHFDSFIENNTFVEVTLDYLALKDIHKLHAYTNQAKEQGQQGQQDNVQELNTSSYHTRITVKLPYTEILRDICTSIYHKLHKSSTTTTTTTELLLPKVQFMGWERMPAGSPFYKYTDLSTMLQEEHLIKRGAELHLNLMKWRSLPQLDIDKTRNTKVLIVGAGTLGCNVSRLLLSWGYTHLTILDNGTISSSNPIRQNLYYPKHVGSKKATVAAEQLLEICPHATITGHVYTIPMPGHAFASQMKAQPEIQHQLLRDIVFLAEQIASHDLVFLLTDSRESRWLPSVFASMYNKPVITTALGFDSYLVMRHGIRRKISSSTSDTKIDSTSTSTGTTNDDPDSTSTSSSATTTIINTTLPSFDVPTVDPNLSCYFCIDITPPMDAAEGRTLDQQCTVTRPGLAYISSGYTGELAMAITQSKHSSDVPPLVDQEEQKRILALLPKTSLSSIKDATDSSTNSTVCKDCGFACCHNQACIHTSNGVGRLPHQIRGNVSDSSFMLMHATSNPYCCACSTRMIQAVHKHGIAVLVECLVDPSRIIEVSGMKELLEANVPNEGIVEWEDFSDEWLDE